MLTGRNPFKKEGSIFMLGTKRAEKKNERKDNMEKILVQILDELKDVKKDIHDVKLEMHSLKEENRKEHKAMKQDIEEIKDKQEKMEQDIVEIKEEQEVIKQKVAYNTELIKKMTKDIIDSIDIIKGTVTRINNSQIAQIRHIMLKETVNFEKNKEHDAILALHHERIGKCEENLKELLKCEE